MSQKRGKEQDGSSPEEKRQRVPALRRVILEAVKMDTIQKICSTLEPVLRRIVSEEVELALAKHSSGQLREQQIYPSLSRSLQLQFTKKLFLPIFTGTKIEGEDSCPIAIELVDSLTGQVVTTGPESSVKAEIVVLEGDFEGDEELEWTFEEFKNNVVRERDGKRPLLMGDLFLNLDRGTRVVGELTFTDNSSWTRSRKFRLGATVAHGYLDGERVKEAVTESFMVKDHRGELYKKHHPPSLGDEVWRLEKIGKDGAFHKRLNSERIFTVKDFLRLLVMDSQRLRNILGTGMSARMWEVTVDHAKTCPRDTQVYVYYPDAQPRTGVIFSVIGEVLGLLSETQYVTMDKLSDSDKTLVCNLAKAAYENWNQVVPYDSLAMLDCSSSLYSLESQALDIPHENCNKFGGMGFTNQNNISFPDRISSVLTFDAQRSLDDFSVGAGLLNDINVHGSSNCAEPERRLSSRSYGDPGELCRITDPKRFEKKCEDQASCADDDHLLYFDSNIEALHSESLEMVESGADLECAVSDYLAMSARSRSEAHSHLGRQWTILIAVLRWGFSIKRIIASKKKEGLGSSWNPVGGAKERERRKKQ
ncbi:calmodulin-binding protein 60 A isoform X2 [Amborella trichopoda]|uniref:calmodulin-binding protein 60 A isoform X2 n=1 Tax=Amborella trichopoda TaxID=13333 RepID=UPI0009BE62C2|nr:calmodulin-binding protein 60 A isoform X2 [Amborella trichopoda]|eukprot:XP_020520269.1 calmodulin-binding protein 60 A isoform X2 [Amborella trichopoda]